MVEEQHRLDQLQLDENRPAGVVPQHVRAGVERYPQPGGDYVMGAASQVQHVGRWLEPGHVLDLALRGWLAEP